MASYFPQTVDVSKRIKDYEDQQYIKLDELKDILDHVTDELEERRNNLKALNQRADDILQKNPAPKDFKMSEAYIRARNFIDKHRAAMIPKSPKSSSKSNNKKK